MSHNPNPFEFEALEAAVNYRRAILREFLPFLAGDVVEIGAGVGQFTAELIQISAIRHLIAVEPDSAYCAQLERKLPEVKIVHGFISKLSERNLDAIVSVNVLEHIAEHEQEVATYHKLLSARGGHLCLFVPAGPALYSRLDAAMGHERRYRKRDLVRLLAGAGFKIVQVRYFNFIGYFLWWLEFRASRRMHFNLRKVRLFDAVIFPIIHTLESRGLAPPCGQSILAVAQAGQPEKEAV